MIPPEGKTMTRSWAGAVQSIVRNNFENCCSWRDFGEGCVVVKHVDVAAEAKVSACRPQHNHNRSTDSNKGRSAREGTEA